MIDAKNFLKEQSDKVIFSILINIGDEIKSRLINLLKEHNCTSVYFSKNDDVYALVSDTFGTHGWDDKMPFTREVAISQVGYENLFEDNKVYNDILYVIDEKGEMFSGDEINEDCFWDIYHTVKELLNGNN